MKLANIKVNSQAIEQGGWVDDVGVAMPELGDLRLKVRGLGNEDYQALYARLAAASPAEDLEGGRPTPAAQRRIQTQCLVETVLLDWGNLDVPYSKERAAEILADPDFRALRAGVIYAASVVGRRAAQATEDAAKN